MQMEVREGRSEGVRDRAAGLVFGVDLIARHYCGILLYTYAAGHLGSQRIRATAQHSSAQQSKAKAGSRSRQGEASERRVPSGWKLSRQLAPWPLTIAAEHPA